MPICHVPGRFGDQNEKPDHRPAATDSDWREPPGYLGEAVRRAKRISDKSRNLLPGNHHKD